MSHTTVDIKSLGLTREQLERLCQILADDYEIIGQFQGTILDFPEVQAILREPKERATE